MLDLDIRDLDIREPVDSGLPPGTRDHVIASRLGEHKRRRLIEEAAAVTGQFYAEGSRAVGVDRIVAEAGVTKATFYHTFRSKDELVRAYLDDEHKAHRDKFEAEIARHSDPLEAILAVFDHIGDGIRDPGCRGCPFLNTATEYPDPSDPVAAVIAAQRAWLRDRFASVLTAAGYPQPERTGDMLVLLRDGAIQAGTSTIPPSSRAPSAKPPTR